MRELQLWEAVDGLGATFKDIEDLAEQCRFRDCQHHLEPGCAVQEAIKSDIIPLERFLNYEKMQREYKRIEEKRKSQDRAREKKKFYRTRKARE